jgi:putative intracellular protease/amidase
MFGFAVKAVGLAAETVVTMGGLKVMPDLPLSAFVPESADILILPGGESWTDGEVPQVSEVVRAMVALSRPVAAICAATLAWLTAGCSTIVCIRATARTSSGSMSTSYRGEEFYRASPAARDRCVITANGLAPFAFAVETFRASATERERDIETYGKLYSHGVA